jgi:ornithine decarboxylase
MIKTDMSQIAQCRTEMFSKLPATVFADRRESFDFARDIAHLKTVQGDTEPFYVMNMGRVNELLKEWFSLLPRVLPFYSVNCNSDPVLLRLLANHSDVGLYCTTRANVELASDYVSSDRIIYANQLWTKGAIGYAKAQGVRRMTFDSERDLDRIVMNYEDAELILNVCMYSNSDDPSAQMGCDISEAPEILETAALVGARVVGIGFNLGSGCSEPHVYVEAIQRAAQLIEMALSLNLPIQLLNIGGGFSNIHDGSDMCTFHEIAGAIRKALDAYLNPCDFPRLSIVANPGRFFAGGVFSLITNVIGKTLVDASNVTNDDFDSGNDAFIYQTNEGYYGSFGCRVVANCNPECSPLFDHEREEHTSEHFYGSVLGPTSDEFDVVQSLCRFRQLCVGDWLLWANMGAYTMNNRADLGDCDKPTPVIYYFADESEWPLISCHKAAFTVEDDKTNCATIADDNDSGYQTPSTTTDDRESVYSDGSSAFLCCDENEQLWEIVGTWTIQNE